MFVPLVWPASHYNAFIGRADEGPLLASANTSLTTIHTRPSQTSFRPWGPSSFSLSRPSGSSSNLPQQARPSGSSSRLPTTTTTTDRRPHPLSTSSPAEDGSIHASTVRRVHLTHLALSLLVALLSLPILALAADTLRQTNPADTALDKRPTRLQLAASTITIVLSALHFLATLLPQAPLQRFRRLNVLFTATTAIGLFLSVFALVFTLVVENASDASTLVEWSCAQAGDVQGMVCREGRAVVGLIGGLLFVECVAVGAVVAGWWIAGKVGREGVKVEVGGA